MSENEEYDWVTAALAMACSDTNSLFELAKAASLDPCSGDFADIDLGGLDIRNQDFSGWDLRYANFLGSRIAGADLQNARVQVDRLMLAQDWEKAQLSDDVRLAASKYNLIIKNLRETKLTLRTVNALSFSGIKRIIDLIVKSEAEIIRLPNMGRISLGEIKSFVAKIGLRLSMRFEYENYEGGEQRSIVPQIIEYRTVNQKDNLYHLKHIDRALSRLSKEENSKLIRIDSCRVGLGRYLQFDAVEVWDRGAMLVSVKTLSSLSSAPGMLRTAVIRKATPILEDAKEADLDIKIMFIVLKYFRENFEIPRDLAKPNIKFVIYDS